jgi:predicted Zn-dependent peptidase
LNNTPKHHPLFILENGLKVCLISKKNVNTVSINCFIRVGSIFETPQNSGISHFLEHMVFRGNQKLGNTKTTNRKIEAIGGNINATTSCDQTEIFLDYHKRFLETGIRYFCDFIKFPTFENIETERKIILEESLIDYNSNHELIDTDTLTAQCIWPDNPLHLAIIGTQQSIKAINLNDIQAWYQKFFVPNNMIIGITGDINKRDTLDLIANEMQDLEPTNNLPIPEAATININPEKQTQFVFDDENQYTIQWSFPIESTSIDHYITVQLINRILDDGSCSQLQQLIREEKGLVYDISSDITYFKHGVLLSIQCTVSKKKAVELMRVLAQLIKNIIKNGFDSKAVELARLRYQLSLDCYSDSLRGLLSEALNPHIFPFFPDFKTISNIIDRIDQTKIIQLTNVIFNQKKSSFVMVGPIDENTIKEILPLIDNWVLVTHH